MTTFEAAADYLLNVAGITLIQLFALGGPALLLIALLSWLSGWVQRLAIATFGVTMYLLLFGWLGTAIHEIGHLIGALIFRVPVAGVKLFAPDRRTGMLGSVSIKPNYGNLYQYIGLFFVGIAPVVFGTLAIYLALYGLFYTQISEVWRLIDRRILIFGPSASSILSSGLAFLRFVFSPQHFLDWRFYLFLYIAFAVGSSISLSSYDIVAARPGCLTFIVLLFLFNTVLLSIGATRADTFAWLAQYYTFLYILLGFVILLDILAIAILWVPAALRSL
jgi:hypothetical protein